MNLKQTKRHSMIGRVAMGTGMTLRVKTMDIPTGIYGDSVSICGFCGISCGDGMGIGIEIPFPRQP